MAEKRKGKKVDLNIKDNYLVTLGTINSDNPESIFISITSWGVPYHDDIYDYKNIIGKIDKKINQKIYNNIDPNKFSRNVFIVDFKMRESKIEYGKDTFMSCEINLFQKNPKKPTDPELIQDVKELTELVIDEVLENNNYFNFYKSKK